MSAPTVNDKVLGIVLKVLPLGRWATTGYVAQRSGLPRYRALDGLWAAVGLHQAAVRTHLLKDRYYSYCWRRIW